MAKQRIKRDWNNDAAFAVKKAHDRDLEKHIVRFFEKATGLPEGILEGSK